MTECLNFCSHRVLRLVYVNDILLTESDTIFIETLLGSLDSQFAMRLLGPIKQFLGIDIVHHDCGITLSQESYISWLLQKAGMSSCKTSPTPLASKKYLLAHDPLYKNPCFYPSIVGALQYITITRHDVTYAMNTACQFMHQPRQSHFQVVKRILRYLTSTRNLDLFYFPIPLTVIAYSNADWVGDLSDRKSTTGHCVYLENNLVFWSSKKQCTISQSSTKAKYRALASITAKICQLKMLCQELKLSLTGVPMGWCDRKFVISLISYHVFHTRSKHIELYCHFIREKLLQNVLHVCYIPTNHQQVDILTKYLCLPKFSHFRSKFRLFPMLNLRGVLNQ